MSHIIPGGSSSTLTYALLDDDAIDGGDVVGVVRLPLLTATVVLRLAGRVFTENTHIYKQTHFIMNQSTYEISIKT